MKLLITGGTAATALKLLKAFEGHEVVLADYGDVPTVSAKAYQFVSLGAKNEDIVAHNILNACLNEGADAVLPLYSFEAEAIAKSKILFNEFGIEVLLPEPAELPVYLHQGIVLKTTDWAVYKQGKLFFSPSGNDIFRSEGEARNLNGAFVWLDGQFFLVTI